MSTSDLIFSRPFSSSTPILSSVVGILREFVERKLPAGYLKDFVIDTQLPVNRLIRRQRLQSLSNLSKRQVPVISFQTETVSDSSAFSSGVSWHTSGRFMLHPSMLTRILVDDAEERYLGLVMDRNVLRVNVTILVETDLKARDLMMFLKRTLPIDFKTFLNGAVLAAELPSDILWVLWTETGGTDPTDTQQRLNFSNYLKSMSKGAISSAKKTASGRECFFFEYACNPVMSITQPVMSINRDANVVRNASVTFQIEMDVPVPIAYGYSQEEIAVQPVTPPDTFESGSSVFFNSVVRSSPALSIGNKVLIAAESLVTGDLVDPTNPPIEDVTDCSSFLNPDVVAYIQWLIAKHGASSAPVQAVLTVGGNAPTSGWNFNFQTLTLTIGASVLRFNYKYSILIYVDFAEVAEFTAATGIGSTGRALGQAPFQQ